MKKVTDEWIVTGFRTVLILVSFLFLIVYVLLFTHSCTAHAAPPVGGMNFTGMRSSSPIPHKGNGPARTDNGYIIINGIELRTTARTGIEKLTTPKEVKSASELERRYMSEMIRLRVSVLKSTNNPRYKAVNALYQATGFVGVRGRPSAGYNEDSYKTTRSRHRRMIREGIGDKEEHLKEIRRLTKVLQDRGVNTRLRPEESSSPISLTIGANTLHKLAGIIHNMLMLLEDESTSKKSMENYIVLFETLRNGWHDDQEDKWFIQFYGETSVYSGIVLRKAPFKHREIITRGFKMIQHYNEWMVPKVRDRAEDRFKWKNIQGQMRGIMVASDARMNAIVKPLYMIEEYLDGEVMYESFLPAFLMTLSYLKGRHNGDFDDRLEYVKELATSSPVGSTVYGGSYPVRRK